MEFTFAVHSLFPTLISKVNCHLEVEPVASVTPDHNDNVQEIFSNCKGETSSHNKLSNGRSEIQKLEQVIDALGEASGKAQGLQTAITNASKLQNSNHWMYIMKNSEINNSRGAVIGFLKIGRKKLFIVDEYGEIRELWPLCVLDFYIHDSCQRQGYGLQVFKTMLKVEAVSPEELAIDRPSHRFLAFLKKHFGLEYTIPQANNFVVFVGFFKEKRESDSPQATHKKSTGKEQHNSVKKFFSRINHSLKPEPVSKNFNSSGAEGCLHWCSDTPSNTPKSSNHSTNTPNEADSQKNEELCATRSLDVNTEKENPSVL
ncbi:alpha-tubulin N-acetyltransferase 1-like isoform X1 [Limulus polyphemus]|uniref:Alpha-tubulin N-acetyltransferase n=1 Tax=Limulus polyphemus TaxID=6850 RepID=A0ABM1RW10_LIMPO|nr:alpha-tubulin N-acetyltransferase 1-like isoform X1 [Limulus polyphemus]XP_022235565.1 alpha-tubulin N-acetyltransferase 1-like isoform X1 [Limulus polyphemus]